MTVFIPRILLATDGSEDAVLATRAAVELSNVLNSELHVAHAWNYPPPTITYLGMQMADYDDGSKRRAERLMQKQSDLIDSMGGKVAETHLAQGPPIDVLLDLCDELEPVLVVIGSRGLGTIRRVLLGSVSEGLVHHARVPVLVVRGGEAAWPPGRIVVGDDFSQDAKTAGELAATISKHYGANMVLVHAHPKMPPAPDVPPEVADDEPDLYGRMVEDLLQREQYTLEERAKELEEYLGRTPEVDMKLEDPAAAILDAAGDDPSVFIAVGSRGLGAISRIRLGSVSTKVLRAAEGSVLVYPQHRS
ncbi:MAG: universal stress protein [Rubrobacteraceae bacterium]